MNVTDSAFAAFVFVMGLLWLWLPAVARAIPQQDSPK